MVIVLCPSAIGLSVGSLLFLFDLGKVQFCLQILISPPLHHPGARDLPVSVPSFRELRPGVALTLTPAIQPFEHPFGHFPQVVPCHFAICYHTVVVPISSQSPTQTAEDHPQRPTPGLLEPVFHVAQRITILLLCFVFPLVALKIELRKISVDAANIIFLFIGRTVSSPNTEQGASVNEEVSA